MCVLGGCTVEIISLFVAAFSTGVSYSVGWRIESCLPFMLVHGYLLVVLTLMFLLFQHPYIFKPRKQCVIDILSQIDPKVVVLGEGADGKTFDAFMDYFDSDNDKPVSRE